MLAEYALIGWGNRSAASTKAMEGGTVTEIKGEYKGNLFIACRSEATGAELTAQSKFEDFGEVLTYTPTDLLAVSLASCALNTIAIYCHRRGIDIEGATFTASKTMATNPNRIAAVEVAFTFPAKNYGEKERAGMERSLRACPVHNSLSEGMSQTFVFNWLDDKERRTV